MKTQTVSSIETDWFNDIISTLKQDKQLFKLGILPKEKYQIYDAFIKEDYEKAAVTNINLSTKLLTQTIIKQYISELAKHKVMILLMGFSMGNNEILVWTQINDDDEQSEINLFKAEAEVNAKNIHIGINISTTIVEQSDNIQMPSHYIKIFPNA